MVKDKVLQCFIPDCWSAATSSVFYSYLYFFRVLFVLIIYLISEATHKAGIDCHHNNLYKYGTHFDIFRTVNSDMNMILSNIVDYYQTLVDYYQTDINI